jgi:NADPH:quinone reductase-like Zn-dependent oxidoreductase
MKAVVYTRYGPPDVLRLTDVPTPVPKDDEVLVQVHAVSLNASNWAVVRGKPLYSASGGCSGRGTTSSGQTSPDG